MPYALLAALLSLGVFIGMLILQEAGRRVGHRRLERDPEGARAGVGAIDGAVFGLLGLLVAFTFSGAASRFDARRQLVVEEANAIGTAYLRVDVLPHEAQPALRDKFRQYVEARLDAYRRLPDIAAAKEGLARATKLQGEIWGEAVAAARVASAPPVMTLLLPPLNAMIDITTTRTMAAQMHPPAIIFAMLILLALTGSLLAGVGMGGGKNRSWIHMVGFAAVMALAVYVILDIEFPRLGLIRVDAVDQVLVELRESMK
jgi:hypothetical protein